MRYGTSRRRPMNTEGGRCPKKQKRRKIERKSSTILRFTFPHCRGTLSLLFFFEQRGTVQDLNILGTAEILTDSTSRKCSTEEAMSFSRAPSNLLLSFDHSEKSFLYQAELQDQRENGGGCLE